MTEELNSPAGGPKTPKRIGAVAILLILIGGLALPVYMYQSDPGFRPGVRGPLFWVEAAISWALGIGIAAGVRLWAKKRGLV